MVQDYKELLVWQKGVELVQTVYALTKVFPKEEQFCLTQQIRRACISIPSNIAEGQLRSSKKEYRHFISIASGSIAELEPQLILAEKLGYMPRDHTIFQNVVSLRKMLMSLRKKLND